MREPEQIDFQELVRRFKRDITEQEAQFAFFLGAGASISSKIPGAKALVNQWIPKLHHQPEIRIAASAALETPLTIPNQPRRKIEQSSAIVPRQASGPCHLRSPCFGPCHIWRLSLPRRRKAGVFCTSAMLPRISSPTSPSSDRAGNDYSDSTIPSPPIRRMIALSCCFTR